MHATMSLFGVAAWEIDTLWSCQGIHVFCCSPATGTGKFPMQPSLWICGDECACHYWEAGGQGLRFVQETSPRRNDEVTQAQRVMEQG